ncbi:MAG: hypothetical protein GY774_25325 [Planctomycetes bacterium]|nr:hypothetical protein [Planctomycetota bacterium]
MKTNHIVLILITIISLGCESSPYVRSDVFLDSHQINGLFVMPIVTELTIGPDFSKLREEMRQQLSESRAIIRQVTSSELQRRGYSLTGFSEDYHDLSDDISEQKALRESVRAYINPSSGSGDFKQLSAILSTILSDSQEALQVALKDGVDSEEEPNNITSYKDYYPEGTDTVLFLFIKSYAAKRSLFGGLTYESTLSAKLQLVRADDGAIILSHRQEFHQVDILDKKSTERAIQHLYSQIPVKL